MDHAVGFRQLIQQQLGNAHLRLNAVSRHGERMRGSRKTVNVNLPCLKCVTRKLFWRQLGEPSESCRFQTNRTEICQANKSGVTNRAHRLQTQTFDAYRKSTKRSLAAHIQLGVFSNGLTERHIQLSLAVVVTYLPGNDVVTLDIKNLTGALQNHAQRP